MRSVEPEIADAVRSGDLSNLQDVLAAHPAEMHARTLFQERTWLHDAAMYGTEEMVRYLHGEGVPLDAKDRSGESALTAAVQRGWHETAAWMLREGVPVDCGLPVIGAVSRGDLPMCELLAEYGEDFRLVFGEPPRTLLEQAVNFGHADVAAFLRARGVPESAGAPVPTADGDRHREELFDHLRELTGTDPQPGGLRELIPGVVGVSVHEVELPDRRVLFTSGLGTRAMDVPPGMEEFAHAELVLELPVDWTRPDDLDAPEAWPWRWLRTVAHVPHEQGTHLGGPFGVFANEDPPQPLAEGCPYTGFVLMFDREYQPLETDDGRLVHLVSLIPIHTDEWRMTLGEQGMMPLLVALGHAAVPAVVQPDRPSVAG